RLATPGKRAEPRVLALSRRRAHRLHLWSALAHARHTRELTSVSSPSPSPASPLRRAICRRLRWARSKTSDCSTSNSRAGTASARRIFETRDETHRLPKRCELHMTEKSVRQSFATRKGLCVQSNFKCNNAWQAAQTTLLALPSELIRQTLRLPHRAHAAVGSQESFLTALISADPKVSPVSSVKSSKLLRQVPQT